MTGRRYSANAWTATSAKIYAELAEPMPDRLGGELKSIVGPDVLRRPVLNEVGQAL